MIPTTLPTLTAVKTIHKAELLSRNKDIPIKALQHLSKLTDAVLSFTAYYLRFANPECRPEQVETLNKLIALVAELEKTYGFENTIPALAAE